jgi:hypothetical protein
MVEFLVAAVPLLALVVALLFGRYPGLGTAMRLADRIAVRGRFRVPTAVSSRRPRLPLAPAPNGGLLLALSFSGRAPPV